MPRDSLLRIETLGSGQFGQVDKMATNYFSASGDFTFVAVKTLLESDEADEADGADGDTTEETLAEQRAQHQADFENEINTMKVRVAAASLCRERQRCPVLHAIMFDTPWCWHRRFEGAATNDIVAPLVLLLFGRSSAIHTSSRCLGAVLRSIRFS